MKPSRSASKELGLHSERDVSSYQRDYDDVVVVQLLSRIQGCHGMSLDSMGCHWEKNVGSCGWFGRVGPESNAINGVAQDDFTRSKATK